MEQDDAKSSKLHQPPPPSPVIVGMAVNGNNKKSRHIVRWAFDKFSSDENVIFKLIHVRPPVTAIPNPMGGFVDITQVHQDVAITYKQGIEKQTNEMLSPYKIFLLQNKVQFKLEVIESDDVVTAVAAQVATDSITNLVIGATSTSMFSRLLSSRNLSAKISEYTPSYCTVYAISKGKLVMVRSSECDPASKMAKDKDTGSETSSNHSSSSISASLRADSAWTGNSSYHPPSPAMRTPKSHTKLSVSDTYSSELKEVYSGSNTPTNSYTGFKSLKAISQTWSDPHSSSDVAKENLSDNQVHMNLELERLRMELRQVQGMYLVAQTEALDASRKINDLNKNRWDQAIMLQEIKDEEMKAEQEAREERMKYESVVREVEAVRERAAKEAEQKIEAERKAKHNAKQKEKLQSTLAQPIQQYQRFTWEEIVVATSSFAENLIIGKGANGTVYKCTVHHTTAAAKVLHSNEARMAKQFQKELEVLSKIRHPHLLLLLGACPERGCIIYEYMDNGNLDERLNCKSDKPPIPWYDRFRIAWEVASTLAFLHNAKPKPIVHRDLKPENILLDHNLVSKIGDVGLSTMIQNDVSFAATMYKNTGLVGTLCYIDPEYQRTGVISTQSDVYAYGMVLLQLLTAKSAMALAHVVENAIRDGKLMDVLDARAGKWPMAETTDLALLALSCVELHRRDRPDLRDQILPKLEILKEAADSMRDAAIALQSGPPSHFICPILQEVMMEPCVAADGYTYDRNAIEKWLEKKENSPMTNLPMPSKNLIPNYTLLSAIMEWKSGSS
uniref:RING-type E3 ubiquitin transferase n=1 Tax=Kalanchoe fedtschenkoi TaxID=63787 RepID=A0A7N0T6I2_KALFE